MDEIGAVIFIQNALVFSRLVPCTPTQQRCIRGAGCQGHESCPVGVYMLDAYSRAVVSVVDSVGPAVVSISGDKNQHHQATDQAGAGFGVVIAPEGYILINDHAIQNENTLN